MLTKDSIPSFLLVWFLFGQGSGLPVVRPPFGLKTCARPVTSWASGTLGWVPERYRPNETTPNSGGRMKRSDRVFTNTW